MLAKTSPQPTRLPANTNGTNAAELRLVIRTGQHRGQKLRLLSAQSSIGSALGCTLRAAMPGVAPLHCWIQNSGRITSIQSNGFEVLLNGEPISHGVLHSGDILRLGTLELEIADCPYEVAAKPEAELTFNAGAVCFESTENDLNSEPQTHSPAEATSAVPNEQQADALRLQRRLNHRRIRKVLHQLRDARLQSYTAKQNETQLRQQQEVTADQSQEIEQLQAQVATVEEKYFAEQASSQQLASQIDRLSAELLTLQTSAVELSQQLQAREGDANALQSDYDAQQSRLNGLLEETKKELAKQQAEAFRLESEMIERDSHARSLEDQVTILQQELVNLQSGAMELSHPTVPLGSEDLAEQLAQERKRHEQEAAEFTNVRARLERELTCLAATVREFQAERLATLDSSEGISEEEQAARAFAHQELATMLHKRQAEQEEWTRVRTRFEQERTTLLAQIQKYEAESLAQHEASTAQFVDLQTTAEQRLQEATAQIEQLTSQQAELMASLAHAQEEASANVASFQSQEQTAVQHREYQQQELSRLNGYVETLQIDICQREEQLAGVLQTCSSLEEKLAALELTTQAEKEALRSEADHVQALLISAQEESLGKVDPADLQSEVASLKAELDLHKQSVAEAQTDVILWQDKWAAADEANKAEVALLSEQLAQAQAELVHLQEQSAGKVEPTELQTAIESLQQQLLHKQAMLESAEQTHAAETARLEAELSEVKSLLTQIEAELIERVPREQLQTLQADLDLRSQEALSHTEAQESLRSQLSASVQQATSLQEEIAKLTNRLVEKEQAQANLQEELSSHAVLWQTQIKDLSNELDQVQMRLAAKDAECEQMVAAEEFETLQATLQEQNLKLRELLQSQEQVQQELLAAQTQVSTLEQQLSEKDASQLGTDSDRGQALETMANNLRTLQEQLTKVTAELEQTQLTLLEQEDECQTLKGVAVELESLRQFSSEQGNESEQLRGERDTLHGQVTALHDELHSLRIVISDLEAQRHQWMEQMATATPEPTSTSPRMTQRAESFDWHAERQRMFAGNNIPAEPEASASMTMVIPAARPEVPAQEESIASRAPAEQEQQVDSVLSRLMRAGVWKGDSEQAPPAASAEETVDDQSDNQQESRNPYSSRQGSVTEMISPNGYEDSTEPESDPAESSEIDTSRFTQQMERPSGYQPPSYLPSAEELEEEEESAAEATIINPAPGYVNPPPAEPMGGSDDESIESYMQRLLNRVRGEAESTPNSYAPAPVAAPVVQKPVAQTPEVNHTEFTDHSEYIPRSQAPERQHNMSALRELANTAARSAIEQHAHKSKKHFKRHTSGIAAGLVLGGATLGAIAIYSGMWQLWIGASAALIGSVAMGGKLAWRTVRQMRLSAPIGTNKTFNKNSSSDEEESDSDSAVD